MDNFSLMQLFELALKLDDKSNFYWHFYVATNIVVIGWILTHGEEFPWRPRMVGAVFYVLFVGFNIYALNNVYIQYDAFVSDIRDLVRKIDPDSVETSRVLQDLKEMPFSARYFKLIVVHGVADLMMLAAILAYGAPWKQPTKR